MNIQTAIKKAIDENSFIARKSLNFGEGRTLIRPTNSSDCCIVVFQREGAKRRQQIKCWNPTVDDLLAEELEKDSEFKKQYLKTEKFYRLRNKIIGFLISLNNRYRSSKG